MTDLEKFKEIVEFAKRYDGGDLEGAIAFAPCTLDGALRALARLARFPELSDPKPLPFTAFEPPTVREKVSSVEIDIRVKDNTSDAVAKAMKTAEDLRDGKATFGDPAKLRSGNPHAVYAFGAVEIEKLQANDRYDAAEREFMQQQNIPSDTPPAKVRALFWKHVDERARAKVEALAKLYEMPIEHYSPPAGWLPCTRPAPHDGPCAHPRNVGAMREKLDAARASSLNFEGVTHTGVYGDLSDGRSVSLIDGSKSRVTVIAERVETRGLPDHLVRVVLPPNCFIDPNYFAPSKGEPEPIPPGCYHAEPKSRFDVELKVDVTYTNAELYRDVEEKLVRELGERIGYGRTMQLCEKIWSEKEPKGMEHTCGPCGSMLVPCICREQQRPAAGCDWCCGVGRVTERVRTAAEWSSGETYAIAVDDWHKLIDLARRLSVLEEIDAIVSKYA